jgi:hypothetical protein
MVLGCLENLVLWRFYKLNDRPTGEYNGRKKEKLKSTLGWIALGCAIAVACVAAAPLLAVTGVIVAGVSISAAAVTGTTAVVTAVGATAALTKAGLHLSDGEYEDAAMSAVMAVPMMGAAYAYGSQYMSMTRMGPMTTGASGSQAGSGQNAKPSTGAGTVPPGYKQDASGRWHRPDGTFASNKEVGLPSTENGHYLHRPYIRQSTQDAVNANTRTNSAGQIWDDIGGKWVNRNQVELGHRPGNEFAYERNMAESKGWSQEQFNNHMNNPDYYAWQDIHENRSHMYEFKH